MTDAARVKTSDLLVTLAILALALVEAVAVTVPGVGTATRLVGAVLVAAPLAVRRRLPLVTLGVVMGTVLALTALGVPPDAGLTPVPSIALAAWSVADTPERTSAAIGGGLAALAAVVAVEIVTGSPTTAGFVFGVLIVAAPWSAGFALRGRTAETLAERERAADAERRRVEEVESAVVEERERIARELHDVVAHSLSIITVQAGAAEKQLHRDPSGAASSLRAVQETSRGALDEMRRMLQLLRPGGADAALAPQPGLDGLDDLVAASAHAGVPVTVTRTGSEAADVPPGVGLAVYRIVQEALTNVRKHAGTVPTRVALACHPERIEVEVVNEPGEAMPGSTGVGHGLIGMRERAALYGGTVTAGETPAGGFRIHAVLYTR